MNNRQALSREDLEKRLDAIRDPITGKGLFASGRVSGLGVRDGKVSFTIEAPRDVAEHYVAVRDRAEAEVRGNSTKLSGTVERPQSRCRRVPRCLPSRSRRAT